MIFTRRREAREGAEHNRHPSESWDLNAFAAALTGKRDFSFRWNDDLALARLHRNPFAFFAPFASWPKAKSILSACRAVEGREP